MSNQIVSVRIPTTLTEKLKEYAAKKHYMDVSEVVRALLRKRWMEQRDPYSTQVNTLRKDISAKINKINDQKNYERLLQEIEKIKKELLKKAGEGQ